MAQMIYKKFQMKRPINMRWIGFDTKKEDPADILINNIKFSLKEESFILENMGLYKFLNLLTNSKFTRGLNVFEFFALTEYTDWFNTTWNILITHLKSNKNTIYFASSSTDHNKKAQIFLENNEISLRIVYCNETVELVKLPINCTLIEYKRKVSSKIKERVFAKWINSYIVNNHEYLEKKRKCAEVASEELAKYIMEHLDYQQGIARLLRIHESSYYYAKVTQNEVKIYYVPSIKEFSSNIYVKEVVGRVPKSQVNIYTTIENFKTKNQLVIRNECRFSHGQFNGTPEAKMYYERGSSLSIIYEKI